MACGHQSRDFGPSPGVPAAGRYRLRGRSPRALSRRVGERGFVGAVVCVRSVAVDVTYGVVSSFSISSMAWALSW
jgi:hypothetical protein